MTAGGESISASPHRSTEPSRARRIEGIAAAWPVGAPLFWSLRELVAVRTLEDTGNPPRGSPNALPQPPQ
jgi:hypothetical protein